MSVSSNLAAVVLLATSCASLGAEPTPLRDDANAKKSDRPWGKESEGFRSRIWFEKKPSGVNDPVKIHYEIENVSKKHKRVWHSGFWPNNRIDVKGPDGDLAPMTKEGEQRRKAFSPGGGRDKNFPWDLAPGASDSSLGAFNVRAYFPMADEGTYTIQYVYQDDQDGAMKPVKSNILKVVVPGP